MRLYPFDSLSGWEHSLTNCVAPHSCYLFHQWCSWFWFLLCLLIFERSSKNANTGNKHGDFLSPSNICYRKLTWEVLSMKWIQESQPILNATLVLWQLHYSLPICGRNLQEIFVDGSKVRKMSYYSLMMLKSKKILLPVWTNRENVYTSWYIITHYPMQFLFVTDCNRNFDIGKKNSLCPDSKKDMDCISLFPPCDFSSFVD